jgi:uncharacterized protein
MTNRFHPLSHYLSDQAGYKLLPFRFMRIDGEVLIVNEIGEFLFLDPVTFRRFVRHELTFSDLSYRDLKSKHILADQDLPTPLALLATKYRSKKSFLSGFTKLHLIVVTLRCDHSCKYCQVSRVTADPAQYDMSIATADRVLDLVFRSPSPSIKIEFQGGESLLNFEVIRYFVEKGKKRAEAGGKEIAWVVATNLAPLTDEILSFCLEHRIALSTSLDGPAFIHNANRPRPGNDSYDLTIRNLKWARTVLGEDQVSALMTATQLSLQHPRAIVDEYVERGFQGIVLRPISPFGFAVRATGLAYQTTQFLQFYQEALDYIIELNRRGVRIVEGFAQILLTKMLTPFATGYVDLQSPAGLGISVVAYNYDGDVYASDEGRMLAATGDSTFRLGSVHENAYEALFGSTSLQTLIEATCAESLPGCVDCAYLPYCGTDPVFNYQTQGDVIGHRPSSSFCAKNMGIITHLFRLLRGGDAFTQKLLLSWATDVEPSEA